MPESSEPVTPQLVMALASFSDLALSPERAQELAPHLDTVMETVARLRGVDVTQHEPVLIFRPQPYRHKDE